VTVTAAPAAASGKGQAGAPVPEVPAAESPPTPAAETCDGATVEVDLYSGRVNPVVCVEMDVAAQVQRFIRSAESLPAGAQDAPEDLPLGFRGLLLTVPGTASPSAVRVTAHAVYFGADGGSRVIEDPSGTAFALLWPSVRSGLAPAVIEAVVAPGTPPAPGPG
jgi:hypothetical protein